MVSILVVRAYFPPPPRPALVYMPRIPYMSTPAAPGLYRQGNTHIARSASSLASNVFPIRLRRVYAYTFSLVPCFYSRRSPLQLRSTAGANACPHGAGRTPCLSRVPVSFSVSLTFFSHGFQIYGHRARTFLSSLLAFGSCMHLLSRLKLSFLFLLAAHSCTLLFSTGFSFFLSSSSSVCIFIIVPSFLFPGGTRDGLE